MRKLLLLSFVAVLASFSGKAQDRVNSAPATLSYKSKEMKTAQYWQKSSQTGQWETRKNTKLVYLGEGVSVDTFNSLFIGNYAGQRYMFLDYIKYSWRYPALQKQWIFSRTIMASLLSENDYTNLSTIAAGNTLIITPRFYHEMYKGHAEYSFPFFLKLGETVRSSSETLYESYKKSYGESFAESRWKESYPLIYFIILKRVVNSNGRDVVRFRIYPTAIIELIDSHYFEVDYSAYKNLFTEDKNRSYK